MTVYYPQKPPMPPLRFNVELFIMISIVIIFSFLMGQATAQKESSLMINSTCNCEYNIQKQGLLSKNIQSADVPMRFEQENDKINIWGVHNTGYLYGNSMQPTFFEGNTALLRRLTDGFVLRPGMIVRFNRANPECLNKTGEEWVIHRIDAIYDDNYITVSGDNTDYEESIRRCQITDLMIGIIFT